jgi:hypothetical protein
VLAVEQRYNEGSGIRKTFTIIHNIVMNLTGLDVTGYEAS